MSKVNRRNFLQQTAVAGGAAFALQGLIARGLMTAPPVMAQTGSGGYGALVPKAANNTGETLLSLPEGFQYNVIGKRGALMSDGRPTPGAHDGQAAFAMSDGRIRIVRNHEQSGGGIADAAIGSQPYDAKATGGTTTLEIDPATRLIVRDFISLSGTVRNCAGGPTPWGSWITNEETTVFPSPGPEPARNYFEQVHGYNFEVYASADGEVTPVALKAMGRFSHEALAVDPLTNYIYETEDANPSGFYRFIPGNAGTPGDASRPPDMSSGVLQMLVVKGRPRYDTRTNQTVGQQLEVSWVTINDPDPLLENGALSVVNQGRARGGAIFSRLEGCWYADGSIYFVSTDGGNRRLGQIWQYTPAAGSDGMLTLIVESTDANILESPDNITVSPRGGLVLCEDGGGVDYVRGVTRQGQVFDFALRVNSTSEAAGATFSPDGQTLFFNYQGTGETFAVWPESGRSWSDGAL